MKLIFTNNNKEFFLTTEIILIGLIIFLASFNQGLTGFGFAITSVPLLSIIIGVKEAVPLAAICGLVVNIYLTIQLREHIYFSDIKYLLFSSIIGIPIGVYFLSEADPVLIEKILAVIVLLFVFLNVSRIIKPSGVKNSWGLFYGFIAGIMGGAFNTNGPPILIYLFLKNWGKYKQKAVITGYFMFTSVLIVAFQAIGGVTTQDVLIKTVYAFPFLLAGLLIGTKIFVRVSPTAYHKIILLFLGLMAVVLLVQ